MMRYSAGIIPFRINNDTNKLEFFVGHPGGFGWENKNFWMFMKGHVEGDELLVDTALREFKEETGLTLDDVDTSMLIPLGTVVQNQSKRVAAYALYYPNIDPEKCFSNPIEEDGVTPEIDAYKWITYEDIQPITHKTHIEFYKQIYDMLGLEE